MEPFIGQIMMFGGNFAPRGWALCNGQLLAINSNQALFSILGTTYGGDGRTSFGLPDLRGRFAMHAGNGPGLTPRALGAKFGTETNTLNQTQLPSHNHAAQVSIPVSEEDGNADEAAGHILANAGGGEQIYHVPDANTKSYGGGPITGVVGHTGNNQPVNNLQPTQVVNYIIALQGIFPSRS